MHLRPVCPLHDELILQHRQIPFSHLVQHQLLQPGTECRAGSSWAHPPVCSRISRVQTANTTKKRTRAWDDIKKARDQVEQHVRSYHRARRALINLGANLDVMEVYKSIERSDLALSGDVVDPGRLGQRNDSLAWFWRQGGSHLEQNKQWMQKCESCVFLNTFYKLTCWLQSIEWTFYKQKLIMIGGKKSWRLSIMKWAGASYILNIIRSCGGPGPRRLRVKQVIMLML